MSQPIGTAISSGSQLDQLESMLAKQRELQTQLGKALKDTRAEVGYSPSLSFSMPQINMQNALMGSAVVASALMFSAMLWVWKTRQASNPVVRRSPAPILKESAFAPPGRQPTTQDSGFAPVAAPAARVAAPALRPSASFSPALPVAAAALSAQAYEPPDILLDDEPTDSQPTPEYSGFSLTEPPALDAALDFEDSQVDFDLSDFDHGDDDFLNQPLPSLSVPVEPPRPQLMPMLDMQPDAVRPYAVEPSSSALPEHADDEPMAVFVEGQVQLTDTAHDMLEWDLDQPAAPVAAVPTPSAPTLRTTGKVDSEVPSQFDTLQEPVLPPAVPFIAPVAHMGKHSSAKLAPADAASPPFEPQVDAHNTGQDTPLILPYEFELSEDDAQWAAELDLAIELAQLGQLDESESICQEVFTLGTEPMREYALYIMTCLPQFKRA